MRGAEESVDGDAAARFRVPQDGFQRGGREHVVAENREIAEAFRLRLADGDRGRRRGGLEADGEEHHVAARILARDLERVVHRIDHADIRAVRLRLEKASPLGGRHAQHVAIAAKDDAMPFREFERIIDAADGQDADRAAGAMHIADVSGQQVVDAIAEDRVGVAAAKFHDVVAAGGARLAADGVRQPLRQLAIAKFVDIFHGAASTSAASSASSPASRIIASVRSASSGDTL